MTGREKSCPALEFDGGWAMRKRRLVVTNEIFEAAHELMDNDFTNRRIGILLGISEATVSRILKCETFKEYRTGKYADNYKLKQQPDDKKEDDKDKNSVPVYASYAQIECMNRTLNSILDILKRYLEV